MFQKMLQIIFEFIPVQETISKVLKIKYCIFLILHFDREANGGAITPAPWLRYLFHSKQKPLWRMPDFFESQAILLSEIEVTIVTEVKNVALQHLGP